MGHCCSPRTHGTSVSRPYTRVLSQGTASVSQSAAARSRRAASVCESALAVNGSSVAINGSDVAINRSDVAINRSDVAINGGRPAQRPRGDRQRGWSAAGHSTSRSHAWYSSTPAVRTALLSKGLQRKIWRIAEEHRGVCSLRLKEDGRRMLPEGVCPVAILAAAYNMSVPDTA
eukprot:521128-Rhodomonas_salina.2